MATSPSTALGRPVLAFVGGSQRPPPPTRRGIEREALRAAPRRRSSSRLLLLPLVFCFSVAREFVQGNRVEVDDNAPEVNQSDWEEEATALAPGSGSLSNRSISFSSGGCNGSSEELRSGAISSAGELFSQSSLLARVSSRALGDMVFSETGWPLQSPAGHRRQGTFHGHQLQQQLSPQLLPSLPHWMVESKDALFSGLGFQGFNIPSPSAWRRDEDGDSLLERSNQTSFAASHAAGGADDEPIKKIAFPAHGQCPKVVLEPQGEWETSGCAFSGCFCAWAQQCYPRYVPKERVAGEFAKQAESKRGGSRRNKVNVGVCEPAVPVLMLCSVLTFGGALFFVVATRTFLHWREQQAFDHQSNQAAKTPAAQAPAADVSAMPDTPRGYPALEEPDGHEKRNSAAALKDDAAMSRERRASS